MKKTKIGVDIHKEGLINSDFLKMIAAHNEGKVDANMQHFLGLLLHNKVEYPSTCAKAQYKIEDNTLHITMDNWATTTLSLTWKEVHELSETEKEMQGELEHGIIVLELGKSESADDLKNVNI